MFFVPWGKEEKNRKYVIRREEEISKGACWMLLCKYMNIFIQIWLLILVDSLLGVPFVLSESWKSDQPIDVFSCVISEVSFFGPLALYEQLQQWDLCHWAAVEVGCFAHWAKWDTKWSTQELLPLAKRLLFRSDYSLAIWYGQIFVSSGCVWCLIFGPSEMNEKILLSVACSM